MASSENLIRIVLIGKTGVGKSSTGNTILGEKCFASKKSFDSQSNRVEVNVKYRFGKRLLVVDTPGLFDTDQDVKNEDIMLEIKKAFVRISPGPHAVILVVRIDRYGDQERDTANLFLHWFGSEMLNYFFVVFTGLDDLDEDQTFDDIITTASRDIKKLLELCKYRYMAFANKRTTYNPNQACELVDMINRNIEEDYNRFYTNRTFEQIEDAIKASGQPREQLMAAIEAGTAYAITFLTVVTAPIWIPFYVAKGLIEKIF